MSVELIVWGKRHDFKFFGTDVNDLRVYHTACGSIDRLRVTIITKLKPLVNEGDKIDAINIPYNWGNDIMIFKNCFIQEIHSNNDYDKYETIFIAENVLYVKVVEFDFKDGKRIVLASDFNLVKSRCNNMNKLTFDDFKTMLFTYKL